MTLIKACALELKHVKIQEKKSNIANTDTLLVLHYNRTRNLCLVGVCVKYYILLIFKNIMFYFPILIYFFT